MCVVVDIGLGLQSHSVICKNGLCYLAKRASEMSWQGPQHRLKIFCRLRLHSWACILDTTNIGLLLLSTHSSLIIGGSPLLLSYGGSPPASPASDLAGLLRRRDPSTNPGPIAWWATEEMLCGMFVSATKGAEW